MPQNRKIDGTRDYQVVCAPAREVSSGSILSKKGSRGWRPLSARGKDSSNCSLSATAILQVRQPGTRFYPCTISSVIRATFSTVSVTNGPHRHARRTSVDPPIPDEIAAARKSAVPCQKETDVERCLRRSVSLRLRPSIEFWVLLSFEVASRPVASAHSAPQRRRNRPWRASGHERARRCRDDDGDRRIHLPSPETPAAPG